MEEEVKISHEPMELVQSTCFDTPFNKVTFGPIQRVNSTGALSVIYYHVSDFELNSSDRIAIYKVGFNSSKDFIHFEWVVVPDHHSLGNPVPRTVTFDASLLPNDEEQLYQVCYLMQDGQIAGISAPFQIKNERSIMEAENAARQVLSIRVRELLKEQKEFIEKIQALEHNCKTLKDNSDSLTKEMNEELDNYKLQSRSLEDQLTKMNDELHKLKEELVDKEETVMKEKLVSSELQEKLTQTVMELTSHKERQKVLMEDNAELKCSLQHVKEQLEEVIKEKEASEKIASDLSERLQKACEEYRDLAKINLKLAKKLKKVKKEMSLMESTSGESFLYVENSERENADEEERDIEGQDETETVNSHMNQAAGLTSSVMATSVSCQSGGCCSSSTKEFSETFNHKMEDILSQLSLQKEQIKSLKVAIAKKKEVKERSCCSCTEDEINNMEEIGNNETTSESYDRPTSESYDQVINRSIVMQTQTEDQKVLYGNSFLPASPTAPVFLPSIRGDTNNQTYPSPLSSSPPSTVAAEDYSIINCAELTQDNVSTLPPPLQPETTAIARTAAVLNHFESNGGLNHSENTITVQVLNQMENIVVNPFNNIDQNITSIDYNRRQHESDDDDYHSTSETESMQSRGLNHSPQFNCSQQLNHLPQMNSSPQKMLHCPMCQLEFGVAGIHLLQEHMDGHLEYVCPVCSAAFERSFDEREFEKHVNEHFPDEEIRINDPSGPWASIGQGFDLLNID